MAGSKWPEDVVREILSMLPVKSLMRFRCVCKTWCALIKSPSFIAQHLNRASTRKTAIVKRSLQHDHRIVLSFISDHDQIFYTETNTNTDIDIDIDIDTLFPKDERFVILLGPFNGILCITHYSGSTVLCNPSIREFKVVPVPMFTYPRGLKGYSKAVGFGFDPNTDDYKVVRIVELYRNTDVVRVSLKVEVYNLSSNSWREINAAIVPSHFDYIPWFSTIVNGALHWYAVGIDGSPDSSILSFHISNEVTRMIPLPDTNRYEYPESLIALNESSLALVVHNLSSVDNHFDIWVMNEYGVKESWSRQFKIRPLSGICRPLAFWNNNNELLMDTSDGHLVSYNLQNQNIKELTVDGVQYTLSVVMYSESLVSINRENEIE